jgi:cyclomaltodextrinase
MNRRPVQVEPGWVEHALLWQVYPLGFVGAEPENPPGTQPVRHRLPAITGWLDHAVELGASGLLLGPVFEAESHGYDTVDPFRVDPRLGDRDDLLGVFAAAHDRGFRVLLDGVFNHVGRRFPRFAAVVEHGPGAPEEEWFRLRWPDGAGPGTEPAYDDFEGHAQLVALNHDSPAVVDYVTEVMCHWLEAGADGWRLDAAYAVPVRFWAEVSSRVRERHPDAYLVGEVIHGDYASYVTDGGLDSVTQYELWKAIRNSIAEKNLYELAWSLRRHDEFLEAFVPLTFVGNHDVTRIASAVPAEHLPHALAILCCVGGTPTIYYGDELGWEGVKEERFGGDDAIRPAFPTPAELGAGARESEVLDLHRELIALRRRHPWLHAARTTTPHLDNEQAVFRSEADDRWIDLALNLADEPQTLPVPGDGQVLAGSGDLADAGSESAAVGLPAHGWAVLGPA